MSQKFIVIKIKQINFFFIFYEGLIITFYHDHQLF